MDEQLIAEVQNHGVIYNRQKYFINNMGQGKYESKDEAWQIIAMKLGSDVDTCKKRWKYMRERYVSQRKQSDPPVYEHLSRPYLEKMKFLDQHITPRKSYRNVPNFMGSPNSSNFLEYNMDSSKSNGSTKNGIYTNYNDLNNAVKTEPDFREFAAAVANQHLINQQINNQSTALPSNNANNSNYYERFRESEGHHNISSSSSLKSPISLSPNTADNSDTAKPRVQVQLNNALTSNDDSSDDNDIDEMPLSNPNHRPMMANGRHAHDGQSAPPQPPPIFPNNDFLFSLYQQLPPQNRPARGSEQLVGELVTTELLKMSKEKKKSVQKRILEILFFED